MALVNRMVAVIAGTLLLCAFSAATALAAAESKDYVESSDEIFEQLRQQSDPGYAGDVVEDSIAKFFRDGTVDEGTYPASEINEHDGDLRRVKPAQWTYSGRFFGRYTDDKISETTKWEKEFELNLDFKDFSSYFRWSDLSAFANRNEPFRFEKAQLRFKGDDYKVTVGSMGVLFGRGLALNMYEDRTLDWDSQAEGAKIEWEPNDETQVTALWGTRKNLEDPRDSEVAAGRVSYAFADGVTVGLDAVDVTFPDASYSQTQDPREFSMLGGDVEIRAGDVSLYTEVVQTDHDERQPQSQTSQLVTFGTGTSTSYYANARYAVQGLSVNLEYKYYDGLLQPFSVLPPLRRWNEKAQANPDSDEGYLAEVILSPADDGSFYQFHYQHDNFIEGDSPHTELAGIYSGPVGGKTTYILEYWYVNEIGTKHNQKRLTLSHQLNADWTASTYLEHEGIDPGYIDPYTDYIMEGELAYQSIWNFVYTAEFTGKDIPEGQDDRWGLLEVKYRPDEEQEFNLAAGSRREGFVCSGGVCRLEPAFDGLKLDYLRRF